MADYGRVLIADDDDAIRNLVTMVLERAGVPHDAARDGRAAIDLLQQHEYAVLLVDLMMPDVNGFQLLEYLRDQPRRPGTVLIMTAAGDSELRSLDPAVVTTIIRKPFDIHALTDLVRRAAERGGAAEQALPDNVIPFR